MPHGVVPTGAKVGVDATIGEGIPKERFERIAYAYADRAKISDYASGKADTVPAEATASEAALTQLANDILGVIAKEPLYYSAVAERFANHQFQSVARALGKLHVEEKLWQDPRGRLCVRGSEFAAKVPGKA